MLQHHRRRWLALVLAFAVVSTANADAGISTQVDISYEQFTLDNGLTVLVHSDHSTPTVFVGMWYAVGSKNEPPGKTGFAHLFEHLMFQGTANRAGEYFSPFRDAGATGMNGTTSEDRTNYFATVPSGALDMALWMESDRMIHLLGAVDQAVLDEQRGVVQNEKRQSETRPYAKMGERIREGLYPVGHPYRHPIIGSMEDLDAATVEDVHDWFKTYYGAANVVLVLAGDVTVADAREKVERYFGAAPAGEPLAYPKKWVPQLAGNREELMYDRVGQTRITRVWALPGLNDRDTTLMYLVNDSLAGNKNSPLRRKLVDELQLATRIYGGAYGRVLSGEYSLTIDLRPGVDPDEVIRVVDETIAGYLETGPDRQIVENAKLKVNMYMLGSLETSSSIGRMLAEGFLYSDDPLFINKELEWMNAATTGELREVARRWLTRGYYQLTVLPFPDYEVAAEDVDRSAIPEVSAKSAITFPEIETTTLDNGIELVVARRGSIPLVDVSIQIDTGTMAAPADAPGIATFVFGLLDKGTRRYDANELAAARDRIAMDGSFRDGVEQSSLGYRILRPNLRPSLELAAEMLEYPTFPDEELGKVKAQIAAYLANLDVAPARAANSLFDRAVYGDDSPMGAVWTPELLEQVDRDKLRAFHRAEVAPDNMTIFMIGDIAIDEAAADVAAAFGDWSDDSASGRKAIGAARDAEARVILVDYPGAESSTVIAGHAVPPYDADRWTELLIMNTILGGNFESRLNMNLREDKAWSYGYSSRIATNTSGDMSFMSSGQVQTDKTAVAMQEIRREIAAYAGERPATAEELARVKLNLTRSLPGSFSTNRGFLGSIVRSARYGLPLDHAEGAPQRIAAVTLEGIVARARELLDPEKLTWVVVGDLSLIEEDVRALGYGEVEVWDAFGRRVR